MNQKIWYVSYGSNLSKERFSCYINGGTPLGGQRNYEGCRDKTPPVGDTPLYIDGGIYFALRSLTWGGGMAFLDPDQELTTPARAYLITIQQFWDVCAQEMRRPYGNIEIPLSEVMHQQRLSIGDGHYDTLLYLGQRDDIPMITFTAPHRLVPETTPSPNYLNMIASGLVDAHGWDKEQARAHLSALLTRNDTCST